MSARPTTLEVMAKVMRVMPELAAHMTLDRSWLWYTGPSLQGDENSDKRKALKDIGFRFAPKGREVGGRIGYWAHSCQSPMPSQSRISHGKKRRRKEVATVGYDDAMALLNSL